MERGPLLALLAALLFGVSTPAAKCLGQDVNAFVLAGLLYLGSGLGLALWYLLSATGAAAPRGAPIVRADVPWLAAVVLLGGVAGPVFLMMGLQSTSAASASLLLNLEGLATMLVAWIVFRESVDGRLLFGATLILLGATVLSWNFDALSYSSGAGFVALACLCWGIDNNLTRKLSVGDPVVIAMIKGLFAGVTNLSIGLVVGGEVPAAGVVAMSALVGFFAYGTSLVLFVLALRELGTSRTGAYFSTAPFVGAFVSVLMLGDPVGPELLLAGILMLIGVWLHLTEVHDHWHEHEAMTHEHMHVHDAHHQHAHGPDDPPATAAHSHIHTHEVMSHEHKHYPDLHHRHTHDKTPA